MKRTQVLFRQHCKCSRQLNTPRGNVVVSETQTAVYLIRVFGFTTHNFRIPVSFTSI